MSIKKRFKEPSTYAGLAGILASFGTLFGPKAAETVAPVADGVLQAGTAIVAGNPAVGAGVLVTSLLAVLLREKGDAE